MQYSPGWAHRRDPEIAVMRSSSGWPGCWLTLFGLVDVPLAFRLSVPARAFGRLTAEEADFVP